MTPYIFGKSYWRTISEGSEREWLLTNGLGGYANGTVTGNLARSSAGYLIASLRPPVDRYLILAKTNERIEYTAPVADSDPGTASRDRIFTGGRSVDLSCQQYVGYEKDGCKYLDRFELDIVPTFHYRVNDISVRKTVCLVRGQNTAVVVYDVKSGSDAFLLHITPLLNFRAPMEMGESMKPGYVLSNHCHCGTLPPSMDCDQEESHQQQNARIPDQARDDDAPIKACLAITYAGHTDTPITLYASGDAHMVARSTFPTSMATPN
jgi:hypothetical protein